MIVNTVYVAGLANLFRPSLFRLSLAYKSVTFKNNLMTFSKHNLVRRCDTPHPFVYLSGKLLILYSLRHTTKVHAQLGQVSTELSLNKASKQSLSA
jgi:hypothetical protein